MTEKEIEIKLKSLIAALKLSELRRRDARRLVEEIETEKRENFSEEEIIELLDALDMTVETQYGFGDLKRAMEKIRMRAWPKEVETEWLKRMRLKSDRR